MSEQGLTPDQASAVASTHQPTLVIAAAGSGKTTVLVERYLRLLSEGLSPRSILAVTFTNEAASQLRRRIAQALRDRGQDDAALAVESASGIGTLHAFCLRVLREWGDEAGLPRVETVLSPLEMALLFDSSFRRWRAGLSSAEARSLLSYFPHYEWRPLAKLALSRRSEVWGGTPPDPEEARALETLRDRLGPLKSRIESTMASQGAYDFDSLEHGAYRLLCGGVGMTLRNELRAILVDEFQDTSPLQWKILRELMPESLDGFFAVGDPKQSIYRFRQADVRVFLTTLERVRSQNGAVVSLDVNFRATAHLLESVNALAAPLFRASEMGYSPMKAPEAETADGQSQVTWAGFPPAKRADGQGEILSAVERIKQWLGDGLHPSEMAILFRAGDRIPAFAAALESARVPTEARRSAPLLASPDAQGLASFLAFVESPLDNFSLASFLRSRFVGLSYSQMWELSRRTGESWLAKLEGYDDERLSWIARAAETAPIHCREAIDWLFAHASSFPSDPEVMTVFLEPLLSLSVAEANSVIGSWAREEVPFIAEGTPGGATGVRLMTVHAAKGLEFRAVCLADLLRQPPRPAPTLLLSPDELPSLRFRRDGVAVESERYRRLLERSRADDREESKRLLYVALTRAKERLAILLPDPITSLPKDSWAYWLCEAAGRLPPEAPSGRRRRPEATA